MHSSYGTLLAGGAVTIPKLFVSNTNPPQSGLITQRDVIGFDEIAGSSFNADDNKNLYKNYMESGQINRGTITVIGDAGFVFNGNIEFDPRTGMLAEHLFKPLPATISDDTAFHDRWAAYLPGWELPKPFNSRFFHELALQAGLCTWALALVFRAAGGTGGQGSGTKRPRSKPSPRMRVPTMSRSPRAKQLIMRGCEQPVALRRAIWESGNPSRPLIPAAYVQTSPDRVPSIYVRSLQVIEATRQKRPE